MRKCVFTAVGRTAWHIDGSFQPSLFPYFLYHMVCVPLKADTVIAPLDYIVEDLPSAKRNEWEILWIIIIIIIVELDQFNFLYIHILLHKRMWTSNMGILYCFVLFCVFCIVLYVLYCFVCFQSFWTPAVVFETYKECAINKASMCLRTNEKSSQLQM